MPNKTRTSKRLTRKTGAPISMGAFISACLLAGLSVGLVLWFPLLSERWAYELDQTIVSESSSNLITEFTTLADYPLLNTVSRISLGPKFHTRRALMVKNLPLISASVQEQQFQEADLRIITLYKQGAFEEVLTSNDRLVYDLREELKLMSDTFSRLKELTAASTRIEQGEANIKRRIAGQIKRFREFLGLTALTEESQLQVEPNMSRYETGLLAGCPAQPELPNAPASLQELADFLVKHKSKAELEKLNDLAVKEAAQEFRSLFTSQFSTIKTNSRKLGQLHSQAKQLKNELSALQKKFKQTLLRLTRDHAKPPHIWGQEWF